MKLKQILFFYIQEDDGDFLPSKKKKKCVSGEEELLEASSSVAGTALVSSTPSCTSGGDSGGVDRALPQPNFQELLEYELKPAPPLPNAYIRWMDDIEVGEEVEYHVDEEDSAWLNLVNR